MRKFYTRIIPGRQGSAGVRVCGRRGWSRGRPDAGRRSAGPVGGSVRIRPALPATLRPFDQLRRDRARIPRAAARRKTHRRTQENLGFELVEDGTPLPWLSPGGLAFGCAAQPMPSVPPATAVAAWAGRGRGFMPALAERFQQHDAFLGAVHVAVDVRPDHGLRRSCRCRAGPPRHPTHRFSGWRPVR